jgi:DNA-directed RNA polymerase subunit M/transcription elongation factor TFIIS
MSKFCKICNNLLTPNFSKINHNLAFKCTSCGIFYKANESDTLRKERIKENNIMIYKKILDKAVDDPVTIKARIKCQSDKCSGDLCKQVRLGEDMKLYNICITCKFQWLN